MTFFGIESEVCDKNKAILAFKDSITTIFNTTNQKLLDSHSFRKQRNLTTYSIFKHCHSFDTAEVWQTAEVR